MLRVWHFPADVLDGMVASPLYGGQGGLTYTTSDLERENQEKIRVGPPATRNRGKALKKRRRTSTNGYDATAIA